ncbi:cryptochrome/photolyase family protein [Spirobacillus cienkowskii]|uniref:Deoxyribodipyrimidine photo-lyase n=1 Tax=Spirobacillus cienkowskii TaxID=495820 RepID=A0A369KY42_9BACT|nr:MAG: deoxyribodipyrimidine photo-lyase [Spirobacillus cienkowskii]
MEFKRSIVWLRRELRLDDNAALHYACLYSSQIIPVFIFDKNILSKLPNHEDKRVTFIFETLQELEQQLKKQGKMLIVRFGDPQEEIPSLAKELKVDSVFTNNDYEQYAIKRDNFIKDKLKEYQIQFLSFKDQVIFERNEILKANQQPYVVFTPYKNEWLKRVKMQNFVSFTYDIKKFISNEDFKNYQFHWKIEELGFSKATLILSPGRKGALEKIHTFSKKIDEYANNRNFLNIDGTSLLSIHLRFGTISIREAFRFAYEHQSEGANVWISELIWREFYKMILSLFPYVETSPFKQEYKSLKWENNDKYFEKWQQGQTGFPIVDAAMRYFNKTGWMHNRLRMVVASFLTKDLLIDYRKGEKYFADHLLDYDLSANNGGWQWSASTGCDAQPYFRVFNPESQSQKFDPKGTFIKEHCPELVHCDEKTIHAPTQSLFSSYSHHYPTPIVNHAIQREKAIKLFKKID